MNKMGLEYVKDSLRNLINEYTANVDYYRLAGFYSDPEKEDVVIEARKSLLILEGVKEE